MSMKYDFNIDHIDMNTAHGKILNRIVPHSTVLECGCASGYMTKYLREKMRCSVSIIEKDYDSYSHAEPYAFISCHGDLQNECTWCKFAGNKYRYILFADVLEHLTDPAFAVLHAKRLLRPDGRMIISIPNICHNDIIMMMATDNFNYTKYGILDDTHVHFWGLRDFEAFCDSAGLKILETDTVKCGTGLTEHGWAMNRVDPELQKALRKRENGEVYQWIFVCGRDNNG